MTIAKLPQSSPSRPGVYQFRKAGCPLYIGKAAHLKKRLASYFRKNASEKILRLRQEATSITWMETSSEIEALIKEAKLIKKYRPKYNVLMRDDKNYFYVGITREQFPKIFITHQPFAAAQNQKSKVKSKNHKSKFEVQKVGLPSDYDRGSGFQKLNDCSSSLPRRYLIEYIGPFTSGAALKITLKLLRKTFPYCTCISPHKRSCLNSQIGRCPGFCCLLTDHSNVPLLPERVEGTTKESNKNFTLRQARGIKFLLYKKNIAALKLVLEGKRKGLLRQLKRQLRHAVEKKQFEEAVKFRDQIFGIENIFTHRELLEVRLPIKREWPETEKILKKVLGAKKSISRVEGYDISHISGSESTGSMVVFVNGIPEKASYRKFKIKTVHQISDVDMLKEVIRRRMDHPEWPYPDFMLIDGGKPQLNAVLNSLLREQSRRHTAVIRKSLPFEHTERANFGGHRMNPSYDIRYHTSITVAALAKREEELYLPNTKQSIRIKSLPSHTALFLQRVRDESHRFAKKYHHKLREIRYRI